MVLFFTLQAQGRDWAQFTPCGFQYQEGKEIDKALEPGTTFLAPTQPAPSFKVFMVDPFWVAALIEYRVVKGSIPCTLVVLSSGGKRLVVGSLEEVMEKLEK